MLDGGAHLDALSYNLKKMKKKKKKRKEEEENKERKNFQEG